MVIEGIILAVEAVLNAAGKGTADEMLTKKIVIKTLVIIMGLIVLALMNSNFLESYGGFEDVGRKGGCGWWENKMEDLDVEKSSYRDSLIVARAKTGRFIFHLSNG